MKRFYYLLLILTLFLGSPRNAFSATGCTYPTSLDTWVDRIAGDFLTVALLNQMLCGIEKLESGPVRPTDGSNSAPAFSFRDDTNTGIYRSGADILDFVTAGTRRWNIDANGHLLASTNNSFDIGASATRPRDLFLAGKAAIAGRVLMGTAQTTGAGANDLVFVNNSGLRFVNQAGGTSADFAIFGSTSNNIAFAVPAATNAYSFTFGGFDQFNIINEFSGGGLLFMGEATQDHTAPAENRVVVYAKDNGAGKTQLCARFNTGAVQCFATQP